MKNQIRILFFIIFHCHWLGAQVKEINLNSHWLFKQSNQTQYYKASVPGSIFKDLLANQLIPDPFLSDNEKKVQWVENEDWDYQTTFICNNRLLAYSNLELLFEGLDSYAKVYLNDTLLLETNNMFRSWNVNVTNHLIDGENKLHVHFESPVIKGKNESKKLKYTLPEGERVFTRKAQFQYGWDFGPRLVGCGIWKPIKLLAWNKAKINACHSVLKSLTDSLARLDIVVETQVAVTKSYDFQLSYTNQDIYGTTIIKKNKKSILLAGKNVDTISLEIKNPKRWWCNEMGQAFLYYLKITIEDERRHLDEKVLPLGLRTIELVNQKDSIGRSFYFKLNGIRVFMKGANYIPSDIFLSSNQNLQSEIANFKKAHMNMIRIWGGGVYGHDEFYNACDKNGILIWQDFMFAGAMYPSDSTFLSNVTFEIEEQVQRLRVHPCLALWCGNNEINEAWNNWAWSKQFNYTRNDSTKIWKDYLNLFENIIPKSKNKFDKTTPYRASSPSIGWGHQESLLQGDSHYWGVWWGMQPFSVYDKKVGRFMSEFGFQSMPSFETVQKFCTKEDMKLNSISLQSHQKHKTGFETIQQYLEKDYKPNNNLRNFIYTSQLLQRDGMKIAIEAHRRNKPRCMGTLFWQLNDCWPAISWSAIDYYGQPKALFYNLNYSFKQHLISVVANANEIIISCITDSINDFEVSLHVKLMNFKSECKWKQLVNLKLKNSESVNYILNKNDLPLVDSSSVYLNVEIIKDDKVYATNNFFFTKSKYLQLYPSKPKIVQIDDSTIEISSDVFLKDVYLYDETQAIQLDDNYFDLNAGDKKRLRILKSEKPFSTVNLKVLTLNQ